jgi:hypothetical protein
MNILRENNTKAMDCALWYEPKFNGMNILRKKGGGEGGPKANFRSTDSHFTSSRTALGESAFRLGTANRVEIRSRPKSQLLYP